MIQAGYNYDSTVYYRARYYSPAIGRFISEDPIGFRGGINKYAYVGNSPLNFVDPFGRDKNPNNPCGNRVTQGLLGMTNLTLAGLKTVGLGAADTALGALTPETGGGSLAVAAVITTYGVTSIGGQATSGMGQLYTAFTGNPGTGENISQAGDILAGPASGLSTFVATGNATQAQQNANYESAITAGAGLVNSSGVSGTVQSAVDYALGLFGIGCQP